MTEVDCKCPKGKGADPPEFDVSHYCVEASEKTFAEIVGCIENIIISDQFSYIQNRFLEKYYNEFEEDEENRLVYTDIFKNYLGVVEKYIEEQLTKNIPGFDIRTFEIELEKKPNELAGEIYEMLSTFWNFDTFKQMFLEYKKMKEGKSADFSQDILVIKYDLKNDEEQAFI